MKTKIAILFLLALFLTTGIYLGGFASFAQTGAGGGSSSNPLDRLYLLDEPDGSDDSDQSRSDAVDLTTSNSSQGLGGLVNLAEQKEATSKVANSQGNLGNSVAETLDEDAEDDGAFLILDDAPLPDVIKI